MHLTQPKLLFTQFANIRARGNAPLGQQKNYQPQLKFYEKQNPSSYGGVCPAAFYAG